jgi:hypothetical protein
MESISSELTRRIEAVAGKTVMEIRRIGIGRGYTPALRLLVSFWDGASAFAKVGTTPLTSGWLRQERHVYETLTGPFMARYFGWDDDETNPILLIEDLSQGYWPPPWNDSQIRTVLDSLPAMWNSSFPNAPQLADLTWVFNGWRQVAENPEPFLSLQMASRAWLDAALPTLLAIDSGAVAQGESLLHLDLRSDNICLVANQAIFVDWNLVCVGNPNLDLGAWLPSLEAEGGPPPETILPGAGEIAGILSGFFACRAGLPIIPDAPRVRRIQLVQLKTALPWAVRALGLPPLDGKAV